MKSKYEAPRIRTCGSVVKVTNNDEIGKEPERQDDTTIVWGSPGRKISDR